MDYGRQSIQFDEPLVSGVRRNPYAKLPGRAGKRSRSTLPEREDGQDRQQEQWSEATHNEPILVPVVQ